MPRASAADAAKTARRVLDVATRLFTTEGYGRVSIDEIAQGAGVTRGAVYHHYRDKPALLRAAVLEGHQRVAANVVQQADREPDPRDALRVGCHTFLDAITSDVAARLILVEAPAILGWATWRELDAATSVGALRDGLQPLVQAGSVEALTQLLSGAMNEAALWLMEHEGDAPARTAVHENLDRLLDGVIETTSTLTSSGE